MQEQEQAVTTDATTKEQEKQQSLSDRQLQVFRNHRSDILGIVVMATVIALLGVICGAINFVGPAAHYPTWLLVTWFVADLVLMVFVIVHLAIAIGVFVDFTSGSDVGAYTILMLVIVVVGLVLTWILLANRHFAWLSMILFLLLSTLTVIDAYGLYKRQ